MLSHRIIKHIPPVAVVQRSTTAWSGGSYPKKNTTQVELDSHLARFPLKLGDWVFYSNRLLPLESGAVSVVAEICTTAVDLVPHTYKPKPYLLMQLTGTSEFARKPGYAFSRDPWSRWDDGVGMVGVSEEQMKAVNDDLVQNYIKEYLPRARQYCRI